MKRSLKFLLVICIILPWGSCKVNDQSSGGRPPNSQSGTPDHKAVTTGYSDCDFGVKIFNEHATGRIIDDLNEIKSRYGSLPSELKELYPAARASWNAALSSLKHSYAKDYQADLPDYRGPFEDWRNHNLSDDQKFFLVLTELRYGPYPATSLDLAKRGAWAEKANISERLNAHIRVALHGNCQPVVAYKVKDLLNPKMLPQDLENALD
ncbi:hypothetical protein JMN32_10325 [Fulvivirga sp. 29W222]|uniref:Uncharacterized protein n=1 Tax=Fulvivirga marina TaxID=2494733 RepID=A0A937FVG6_9BACT|nr:hypothetical protein [Fulvivirga marina]MBL6446709.1 hypothetical protein [Fulvivirga marina]